MDAGWFGLLNASTLSFLAIYLTRLGASNEQIGIFNAAPALANIFFTLPAGRRMQSMQTEKAVFWSSVAQRMFFLVFILLPTLLLPQNQIWVAIIVTFLLSIPGTILAVAMPTLIAEAVPIEWRSYIAGTRNALLSVVTIIGLLISGQILVQVQFPHGYQIVFAIGFIGAAMSSLHLFFIRTPSRTTSAPQIPLITSSETIQQTILQTKDRIRFRLSNLNSYRKPQLAALSGSFRKILVLLFVFNLSIFLVIPVIQLFQVNGLHLTDRIIGFGTSIFFLSGLIASLQIRRLSRKWSYKIVASAGVIGLAVFPSIISIWGNSTNYLFLQAFAGFSWALINSSQFNYLYENIPAKSMPEYLAWYNLALNVAILLGSLLGAAVASAIGLAGALFLLALVRILSGASLLKWG